VDVNKQPLSHFVMAITLNCNLLRRDFYE